MVKKKSSKECDKKAIIIIIGLIIIGLTFSIVTSQIQRHKESSLDALVIYHWWASSGERVALNSLLELFIAENPNTTIISVPIKGTLATKLARSKELMEPFILANEAPDILQLHVGYSTKEYYDSGLLEPITSSWETSGLDDNTPRIVKSMCKFDGEYYCLPLNVHRINLVWYNKHVLDDAGVDPDSIKTWDEFFAACDKIKASGMEYPVQIASVWPIRFAFEQIAASEGMDFYQDLFNGDITSPDDPRLAEVFDIFDKYVSYTDPSQLSIEYAEGTKRVIDGDSAFYIMGDWANGDFETSDKIYNVDYGEIKVPGTEGMYGIVIDGFQVPINSKHISNAVKWMDLTASKEGQDAFNLPKGSIPIRRDADTGNYGEYQKSAMFDFAVIETMYPDVSAGVPEAFDIEMQDALLQYLKDGDRAAAMKKITDFASENEDLFTIEWKL